jgi:predicted nucleotidyltransferase
MDFVRPVEAIIPGAQGQVLAVLAETTAELNLRTIARLAGVSQAQASRVLPRLVELGVVERREVPPASLFRLVPEHVAARLLLGLARATEHVLDDIGRLASEISPPPAAVIVFGSLARHEAIADSDVDVVVVRSAHVDEDDDAWAESLERWRSEVARLTGNAVQVLEVGADEVRRHVDRSSELWTAIGREGRVVHGADLQALAAGTHA